MTAMRYMKNNDSGNLREITIKCLRCKTTWKPYGSGGLCSCSKCGQAIFDHDPSRGLYTSSLMFERVG